VSSADKVLAAAPLAHDFAAAVDSLWAKAIDGIWGHWL
jgi:hypothetical protein